ncbi:triose-phosphate transporter family-domain-containing protein [Cladochytrium replicatum]|nr:triose-phosphate transporter family-domain-containing protein [Cladochytrium replicatum]
MVRFLVLCVLWYSTSAMTNNLGKQILNIFRYPVTLTLVQFAFVAFFSVLVEKLGWGRLRPWSREIVMTTAPLSGFQIVGHIFSSIAISRVTVSFAHTVKALSPLFTVIIYRVFYSIAYSPRVYLALIPLTVGVMLVCSNKVSFNLVGFVCALGSTITFVLQNIFSKKLFTSPTAADILHSKANGSANGSAGANTKPTMKKLDKLNLLFYSSALAFSMMFPIWFYSEGTTLLFSPRTPGPIAAVGSASIPTAPPPAALYVAFLFFLNGTSHFLQNMFAFWILSLVSPVTYSIASLVKRIYVIVASIIYFGDAVAPLQSFGIVLSVVGLYTYDLAKRDVDRWEAKLTAQPVLPGGA